jgi:hypothetical protein
MNDLWRFDLDLASWKSIEIEAEKPKVFLYILNNIDKEWLINNPLR